MSADETIAPATAPPGALASRFVVEQLRYWKDVDAAHYEWQTAHPYISVTENTLLDGVEISARDRLLEIGCGEGANLYHLVRRAPKASFFGVDFSSSKILFARSQMAVWGARADAGALPFRSGSFDAVLVRDVLHHVQDRRAVLTEAIRILRPGGRITVIEPNGRNPLIALMAAGIREERGMLGSNPARVHAELGAAGADITSVEARQPFPISRVVLHYRLGLPSAGRTKLGRRLLECIEGGARILPRSLWAYFVVRGVKTLP